MKINFFISLFLFSTMSVFSQTVEKTIKLLDKETNLPISDVTVLVAKTNQILQSNLEGKVTFLLKSATFIRITHPSYSNMNVRSSTLTKEDNIIFLTANVSNLDEVILTKTHPQLILKSLVKSSIKKLTVPACLKVYTREFFRKDGKYTNYNDGLLNFQLFLKNKTLKNIILVEQNRSYGIQDDLVTPDVLGYNLNNIMENYYNFNYLLPVLESNSKKKYEYIIKGYSANKDFYIMLISPLENGDDLRDNYKIIYDHKKKLIVEVSSSLSPLIQATVKEKTSVGSRNIYKSMFKNSYRIDNSSYYLVSAKEEIGFEKIEKDKKSDIEVRNYLVTTNFSNNIFTYNDSNIFKDKTIYNKKNLILNPYWNISGLTSTDDEEAIVNELDNKTK
jgi:hypothetical protein